MENRISSSQAHALAEVVYKDIENYVCAHFDEYQQWLIKNGYDPMTEKKIKVA
ncbi:MAG: hypothetical protein RR415_08635 [Ruthenibacterium sp.]